MAEPTIAGALCGVIEQALIEKGVDPTLAKALALQACIPALEAAPGEIKRQAKKSAFKMKQRGKAVSRAKRSADRKLSMAFKEANRKLRTKSGKLRKGKTQADVARMAQKLRKKM